jgi:hypothetical protein
LRLAKGAAAKLPAETAGLSSPQQAPVSYAGEGCVILPL